MVRSYKYISYFIVNLRFQFSSHIYTPSCKFFCLAQILPYSDFSRFFIYTDIHEMYDYELYLWMANELHSRQTRNLAYYKTVLM